MDKETFNVIRIILATIGLSVAIIGFFYGLIIRYTGLTIFNAFGRGNPPALAG